jgi:hypothetical protein
MALLVGSAAADELMLDAPGTHAAKIPVSCDSYIILVILELLSGLHRRRST